MSTVVIPAYKMSIQYSQTSLQVVDTLTTFYDESTSALPGYSKCVGATDVDAGEAADTTMGRRSSAGRRSIHGEAKVDICDPDANVDQDGSIVDEYADCVEGDGEICRLQF